MLVGKAEVIKSMLRYFSSHQSGGHTINAVISWRVSAVSKPLQLFQIYFQGQADRLDFKEEQKTEVAMSTRYVTLYKR